MPTEAKKISKKPDQLGCARFELKKLVRGVERLHLPAFGPAFASLAGPDLADALIGYRVTKNLGKQAVTPKERREKAITAMFAYDEAGRKTGPSFSEILQLEPEVRAGLYRAKAWLERYFGTETIRTDRRKVTRARIKRAHRFAAPSGETDVTSFGDTDLLVKLQDPSQWNVSLEAAKEAAAVCYHTHALKRVVRDKFRTENANWKQLAREWYQKYAAKRNAGFHVFSLMFLRCCNVSNVARLSTVPKNGSIDRVITMTPMWTMVAQLSYALDLRRVLECDLGIQLESRASLHRTLIRHENKATIDFENASNSNWCAVLQWLLPHDFYTKIMQLRVPVVEDNGVYTPLNMLAPMGCGFTFEVMTIVLLALSRAFDSGATVFGDDVIIEKQHASAFIKLATFLGWKVSPTKTFVEGNFRESCGGFHDLATRTDILSYDFHGIDTMFDVCTTINKLYNLLRENQCTGDMRRLLLSCYCKLLTLVPGNTVRDSSEEPISWSHLPSGVAIVPNGMSRRLVRRTSDLSEIEKWANGYLCYIDKPVLSRIHLVSEVSRPKAENVKSPVYLACYMRRGGAYDALFRKTKVVHKSEWIPVGKPLVTVPLFDFI